MTSRPLSFVFLGLSITSAWGNGHAVTYRGLVRELARRGHDVLFLERDVPWYAAARDLPEPPYGRTALYASPSDLAGRFASAVEAADVVVLGSYVPDGIEIAGWLLGTARHAVAFYDIDTPVTLAALARGDCGYLTAGLVRRFDLYLSFTGGPTLQRIERQHGARAARALYCAADPETHYPVPQTTCRWDLGYMGTYSEDRQPALDALLLKVARAWPAGRFVVAGAQYPADIDWPANVERQEHVAPAEHRAFYAAQRFTLNLTRADMVRAGWSPSIRLFEAAACATPIVSDVWPGIEEVLRPEEEVLLARGTADVLRLVVGTAESERRRIGERARLAVLARHTAAHRAAALDAFAFEALSRRKAAA